MPIRFDVDSEQQFVRVTCEGDVTLGDLARYAQRLFKGKLLDLPRLIDARLARIALSPGDVEIFAALMASLREQYGESRVALVLSDEASAWVAAVYRDLRSRANPGLVIFSDLAEGESWLVHSSSPARVPPSSRTPDDIA